MSAASLRDWSDLMAWLEQVDSVLSDWHNMKREIEKSLE